MQHNLDCLRKCGKSFKLIKNFDEKDSAGCQNNNEKKTAAAF
jgi:hypothetical protein